jgi:hypothetical protein
MSWHPGNSRFAFVGIVSSWGNATQHIPWLFGNLTGSMEKEVRGDDMAKLDFGMAMVLARFAGKEGTPSPEGKKMPKANPQAQAGFEKRKILIAGSWLKIPKVERILLPSDPSEKDL